MSDPIPCQKDPNLTEKIEQFSEILKTQAHQLDPFGMTEKDFYDSGIFEGSIQRVRGQISAAMGEKKTFVKHVLNYMQDGGYIQDWIEAGDRTATTTPSPSTTATSPPSNSRAASTGTTLTFHPALPTPMSSLCGVSVRTKVLIPDTTSGQGFILVFQQTSSQKKRRSMAWSCGIGYVERQHEPAPKLPMLRTELQRLARSGCRLPVSICSPAPSPALGTIQNLPFKSSRMSAS